MATEPLDPAEKPPGGETPRGQGNRLGLLPRLLGYHLRRAQIAAFQDFIEAMAEFEITPGRFGVLEVIAANPGLSQSELGSLLGIDRSTVVAVIDRLEQRHLVQRRPVPSDRRSYALTLSEGGAAMLSALEARVLAHEAHIARRLSPAERATLIDLLRRLAPEG
jgi:DNA-binding MarR family transcriptional regulator